MPLPNADIVSAFFESYITIRKGIWNLDVNDNDSIKIPDSAKPVHKITICNEMLLKFKNAVSLDDWDAIVDDLYEKERAERQSQDDRYFITQLFTSSPLLLDVCCAARTYILSEIKSEKRFKEKKHKLLNEQELIYKEILFQKAKSMPKKEIDDNQKKLDENINKLASRDESTDFYLSFFTNTITKADPDSRKLDEKSFNDFKKNVLNKSRPLILCKLLIESVEKKANSNHTANKPESHPTAAVKEDSKSTHHVEKTVAPQPATVSPTPVATVTAAPAANTSTAAPSLQQQLLNQLHAAASQPKPERKSEKTRIIINQLPKKILLRWLQIPPSPTEDRQLTTMLSEIIPRLKLITADTNITAITIEDLAKAKNPLFIN